MRYLLDTCVVMNMIAEPDRLCPDVEALIDDYDNILCISAETLREMIVAFNNRGLVSKCWKTAGDMIQSLVEEYNLTVLPLKTEHMRTYAQLKINDTMGHKDPSDHVIISQAITEHLPLISSDTRFPFYKEQGLDLIENR